MKRIEIKESILKTVEQELDQWLKEESEITCAIEYETKAIEAGFRIVREMIQKSQGKTPKSRNEKKSSRHV